MSKNKLLPVLLMGSALVLTGCGGGSGSSSSSTSNISAEAELSSAQADLKRIQDESQKVRTKLIDAKKKLDTKHSTLNDLQAKLERGQVSDVEVEAANAEYEAISSEIAALEQKQATLTSQSKQMEEKVDTKAAALKLNASLNNLVPSVLSGTFSRADLDVFLNAVQTQSAAQLVGPTNKAIADLKSALSTGAKIKTVMPGLINSPIVDSLLIPFVVREIGGPMQEQLVHYVSSTNFNYYNWTYISTPYFAALTGDIKQRPNTTQYTLDLTEKSFIQGTTIGLKEVGAEDVRSRIFYGIEDYYKKNNPELLLLFDLNDPGVLDKSLTAAIIKLKPKIADWVGQIPNSELNNVVRLIQNIPNVNTANMVILKKGMIELAKEMAAAGLSSEMPSSSLGLLSYRQARSANPGLDLHHLTIDGQSMDQSYSLGLPVYVQLKGDLNAVARTGNVSGFVTVNLNGTMIGFAQALANAHDQHSESSLVMSQSFDNFFAEVQMGVGGIRESLFSGWEGHRYQATLGYDAAYASPFVQLEYRPLSNGFNTLDATGVYVGLETDALKVQLPEATFTSRLLAKIGYESSSEKLFGEYSMKANAGASAYVEWSAGLSVTNGLEFATGFTLGTKDAGFKVNVSFEN